MYNVIINVNNKKILRFKKGMIGELIVDRYSNAFYKLMKKLHFKYLMKFTDVLYETILA